MHLLTNSLIFPSVEEADENGLLAIGGDLGAERLLLAYRSGIFPWFNEEDPICWWSPDPRFVLYPADIKISKSMQAIFRKNIFEFKIDTAFEQVITQCQNTYRDGQDGTWITEEMKAAYINLHRQGYAHSAEAWWDGKLVGGLYGIRLGKVFFGESMFSHASNASKFAFINYVKQLHQEHVELIDCQLHTNHLESLGARMISRKHFKTLLEEHIKVAK
ncbi:MAG: leucyl/phenylalanyl-tRNA--protein transferase [Chitinophagaceae bacterium]|nr:MAG: leucyl/phenylalanyl-tRNA--protein transferase [Chitinophagaceae bacterium]